MNREHTILLAEDHPVNREVAEHILRRLGYHVDLAENGNQVMEAVRRTHYPFILMDLRMPGMDGFEAARRIQLELPAERRPAIAAMTADVTRQNELRCRELGMVAFIPKPIEKKQLAAVLKKYVKDPPIIAATESGEGAGTSPAPERT